MSRPIPLGKQQGTRAIACIQKLFSGEFRRGSAHRRFLELAQAPAAVVIAPASPLTLRVVCARVRRSIPGLSTGFLSCSDALVQAAGSRGGCACIAVAILPGRHSRRAVALPHGLLCVFSHVLLQPRGIFPALFVLRHGLRFAPDLGRKETDIQKALEVRLVQAVYLRDR